MSTLKMTMAIMATKHTIEVAYDHSNIRMVHRGHLRLRASCIAVRYVDHTWKVGANKLGLLGVPVIQNAQTNHETKVNVTKLIRDTLNSICIM